MREHVPGPSTSRRLAATVAVVVSLFASISIAGAATQTVTAQNLTATFTYHGASPLSPSPHLRITQNGKVVYISSAFTVVRQQYSPNVIAGARKVVHIVHLQQDGFPSVVLDLYSGGAHCCAIEQVYSFRPNSAIIQETEHNFGDPGVRLVKLGAGGSIDLLSADDVFAYAFTDFAASGLPIEILSFSRNTFHNVTRSFPKLIAKDASQWMSAFRRKRVLTIQTRSASSRPGPPTVCTRALRCGGEFPRRPGQSGSPQQCAESGYLERPEIRHRVAEVPSTAGLPEVTIELSLMRLHGPAAWAQRSYRGVLLRWLRR